MSLADGAPSAEQSAQGDTTEHQNYRTWFRRGDVDGSLQTRGIVKVTAIGAEAHGEVDGVIRIEILYKRERLFAGIEITSDL